MAAATVKEADPTAHLTFNLGLTDKQRLHKDEIILPYVGAGQHNPAMQISYTPDAADDFDEDEDPDEDLDV